MEISEGRVVLIFGSAGSGKTNLCLWIMSRSFEPSLYVSTEGSIPVALLDRYSLTTKDFYFEEVFSLEDLSVQLTSMYVDDYLRKFKNICIDSVNAHYRYEAIERSEANKLLNTSLAILSHAASRFRARILLTAQVREEEGELIPSGYDILQFWSDVIIEARKSGDVREIELVKPVELRSHKLKFKISDRGVEFE